MAFRSDIDPFDFVEYVRWAEERGAHSAWVAEWRGSDPISLLTAAARETDRIRLATGIINPYTRTPTVIASAFATLDELSQGRMILGLGSSHAVPHVVSWHGLKFEKPLLRTKECIEIICGILTGRTVNYHGRIFEISNFRLPSRPIRRSVPIYLAALGPRMLRLAGEVADGVLLNLCSPDQLSRLEEFEREGARKAGRKGSLEHSVYVPMFASEDRRAAIRAAKKALSNYLALPFYNRFLSQVGFAREAAKNTPTPKMIRELTITGSVQDCRDSLYERIQEFTSAGAESLILYPRPVQGLGKAMEHFGRILE